MTKCCSSIDLGRGVPLMRVVGYQSLNRPRLPELTRLICLMTSAAENAPLDPRYLAASLRLAFRAMSSTAGAKEARIWMGVPP